MKDKLSRYFDALQLEDFIEHSHQKLLVKNQSRAWKNFKESFYNRIDKDEWNFLKQFIILCVLWEKDSVPFDKPFL